MSLAIAFSGVRLCSTAKPDNDNVHRAAAKIIVSKSRAARGSVCNVLLSRQFANLENVCERILVIVELHPYGNAWFLRKLKHHRITNKTKTNGRLRIVGAIEPDFQSS